MAGYAAAMGPGRIRRGVFCRSCLASLRYTWQRQRQGREWGTHAGSWLNAVWASDSDELAGRANHSPPTPLAPALPSCSIGIHVQTSSDRVRRSSGCRRDERGSSRLAFRSPSLCRVLRPLSRGRTPISPPQFSAPQPWLSDRADPIRSPSTLQSCACRRANLRLLLPYFLQLRSTEHSTFNKTHLRWIFGSCRLY